MDSAVNTIDASALESLEAINHRLEDGGITFHLSDVKEPVMDCLKRSHFLEELTGKVHLTQFDAVSSINPNLAQRTRQPETAAKEGGTDESKGIRKVTQARERINGTQIYAQEKQWPEL
jgi:SulP family sulfate permease